MPYTSEIDKLERRYAENPKGRNFAPLADAYRKAGQLDQAIELCKSGLERHPDYVSAHIVYGRCLIDQKDDGGAQRVFTKVLELDPENVIAFRVLAEIAERGSRFDVAVGWLTKLLAADPMNGDAAEALAFAKGKAAQAAPIERPDFVVEHTSVQPVTAPAAPPPAPAPAPAGDLETFDGTVDFNAVAHDAAKAEGLEVQEDVVLKPSEVVIEGLARTQYEGSGMFKADDDDDLPQVDLPLIMPDDPSPEPPPPRRSTPPPARAPKAAAVALSDDDGAADAAALSRAEPVLTETMAELFLRQGHVDEALRVYRALLAQRPADARLQARIAAISSGGKPSSGQTVQAFLRAILAGRPGMATEPATAVATSPLDSAFAQATPDSEAPPGQATYAAEDTISLDQVFGEEGGRGSGAGVQEVPPPPPPPAAPAPRASGATQTGGFSFDEFFGSGAPARNPNAPPAPSPSPAPAPKSRAKQPMEEEGDLDQFQSWLKGLKT